MLRMFLDVSDLRALFQTTTDANTGQSLYLTREDFKTWLMCAVNWVGFTHVDFTYSGVCNDILKRAALSYEGMPELYQAVKDMFDHPILDNKQIFNSYGFIDGDILYIMLDVGDTE